MCTLTIVPLDRPGGGIRLACNRDELRSRPEALPPVARRFGPRRAVFPVDSISGGTWIAVNDVPLAIVLLNVNSAAEDSCSGIRTNSERKSPVGRNPCEFRYVPRRLVRQVRSRGEIIPRLLAACSLEAALDLASLVSPRDHEPFRLVLADAQRVVELASDGQARAAPRWHAVDAPLLFTSSGLGDRLVERPRRALFERFFARSASKTAIKAAIQNAYHRHDWPERRHLSVCMRRAEARTVSFTTVDLGPGFAALSYFADAPDRPVVPVSIALTNRPAAARLESA